MLTREENERLTRGGPGTPGGELLRRYWHPILPEVKLQENPVQKVRILGEDLVCYRDRSGTLGLVGPRCPHRSVDLQFGIPEQRGLRCPYHGWLFDEAGRCLEQPMEPPDSGFKDQITIKAYSVEELGGLVWAYMGPDPVPLLPRWDLLVQGGVFRQMLAAWLPCNWLQVMENRADPAHGIYLHGRYFLYALERQGREDGLVRGQTFQGRRPMKYRFRTTEYGFIKQTLDEGASEETSVSWNVGRNPGIFPYTLRFGSAGAARQQLQMGVPIDDTHTWHITYSCYEPPEGTKAPEQHLVPYAEVPRFDEKGGYIFDYTIAQDFIAWTSQGDVTDRTEEHLGVTDTVIIGYRNLLKQQIDIVQQGGEPMNVFRDPAKNVCLQFDLAPGSEADGWIDHDQERYSPDASVIRDFLRRRKEQTQSPVSA